MTIATDRNAVSSGASMDINENSGSNGNGQQHLSAPISAIQKECHAVLDLFKNNLEALTMRQLRNKIAERLQISNTELETKETKKMLEDTFTNVFMQSLQSNQGSQSSQNNQSSNQSNDSDKDQVAPAAVKKKAKVDQGKAAVDNEKHQDGRPQPKKKIQQDKDDVVQQPKKSPADKPAIHRKRSTIQSDDEDGDDEDAFLEEGENPASSGAKGKTRSPSGSSAEKDALVTKLKGYIFKCGVRKNWKRELDGLNVNAAIKKLQSILKDELGMEGRPSLEKCRIIKEKRENALEMQSIDPNNIIPSRLRYKKDEEVTDSVKRSSAKAPESPSSSTRGNRLDLSLFGDTESD